MKFNASLLKAWMGCPLQARFQEIEKLPRLNNAKAVFGTCIHAALEDYNKTGNATGSIAYFKDLWDDPSKLGRPIDVWPKFTTYGGLRKRGIEIIQEYADRHKWETRTVVATEHKFCVPFGEHLLSGIVDLVEKKKSTKGKSVLRIVDYKTNSKQPNLVQLRLDIQFTIYDYASRQPEFWMGFEDDQRYRGLPDGEKLYEMYQNMDRKLIWYHLWGNKEINAGDRDDMDMMRLYRVLNEVERAVTHEIYVPNISGDTCTYCDYVDRCGVVVPVHEKFQTEIPEDS